MKDKKGQRLIREQIGKKKLMGDRPYEILKYNIKC